MIKLRFSKPKYNTFNNGKVTTCCYNCDLVNTRTRTVINNYCKVKGTAICNDTDTPNPAIGRMIADSRAKKNAYEYAAKDFKYTTVQQEELKCLLEETDLYKRMKYLSSHESKHINSLIYEN